MCLAVGERQPCLGLWENVTFQLYLIELEILFQFVTWLGSHTKCVSNNQYVPLSGFLRNKHVSEVARECIWDGVRYSEEGRHPWTNTVIQMVYMEQMCLFNTLCKTTEVLQRTPALLESKSSMDTENETRFIQQRTWFWESESAMAALSRKNLKTTSKENRESSSSILHQSELTLRLVPDVLDTGQKEIRPHDLQQGALCIARRSNPDAGQHLW